MNRSLVIGLLLLSLVTAAWAAWHVWKPEPLPGAIGFRNRRMGLTTGEQRLFSGGSFLDAVGFACILLAVLDADRLPGPGKLVLIALGIGAMCGGIPLQVITAGRAVIRRNTQIVRYASEPLGLILMAALAIAIVIVGVGVALTFLP